MGAQSLNHWTTREVPGILYFFKSVFFYFIYLFIFLNLFI